MKNKKTSLLSIVPYLIIAILVGVTVAYAGSLTPPGGPAKTMKSISDLYQLINTGSNTPSSDFTTPGSVASTMNSLGDTYDLMTTKIAAIDTSKILTGTSIFGKAGTLPVGYTYGDNTAAFVLGTATGAGTALKNLWNGTSGAFTGGSQANGGADDYNNGGAPASGRYAMGWTQCTVGNTYCGTGDSGSSYKDNSTGLIWSKTMNVSTYALDDSNGSSNWFVANNCTESSGSTCTKKSSSKTGCEATSGWSLPHQKQLMQAYIDGSYGNLEPQGVTRFYWSSTTLSGNTNFAWTGYLSDGYTYDFDKTGVNVVRCVR